MISLFSFTHLFSLFLENSCCFYFNSNIFFFFFTFNRFFLINISTTLMMTHFLFNARPTSPTAFPLPSFTILTTIFPTHRTHTEVNPFSLMLHKELGKKNTTLMKKLPLLLCPVHQRSQVRH